ncbi:MAG: hypothetical protein M0R03_21430 [Novosphingobium sp.]|jgi:hypothetical protein|nr:hypothetical protein [Novosphingobium sp.]
MNRPLVYEEAKKVWDGLGFFSYKFQDGVLITRYTGEKLKKLSEKVNSGDVCYYDKLSYLNILMCDISIQDLLKTDVFVIVEHKSKILYDLNELYDYMEKNYPYYNYVEYKRSK